MGFIEKLRQENQKLLSEATQERTRKKQQLVKQQKARSEEATRKQKQTEAISRARNFLKESKIVDLLKETKNNLYQSGYSLIDLKVYKKDDEELLDYGFPSYCFSGDVVVVYQWGQRNQYRSIYGCRGFSVSISGDGGIDIRHHHYKGWHEDDCPPERLSYPQWDKNRDLLENSLWAAYKNPFPLDYSDQQNRRRSRTLPPSPPYYDVGGRGPCLPRDVLISVPNGLCLLKDLRVGDFVWTSDRLGHRVQTIIVKKAKRIASKNHKMAHIILKDGKELVASLGHPTIDYKKIGSLVKGDILDNASVSSIDIVSYKDKYTYDILPYGDTGGYWANNILIGSTLSSKFEKTNIDNFAHFKSIE